VFFGNGSGVCISSDGYALTNFHASGDRQGQRADAGRKAEFADIVGFDPLGDISPASCARRSCPSASWATGRPPGGQHVIAVGNPVLLGNGSWSRRSRSARPALHRLRTTRVRRDPDGRRSTRQLGRAAHHDGRKVVGINGRIDIKRFNQVNTGIG
jgi:hypothetical protein